MSPTALPAWEDMNRNILAELMRVVESDCKDVAPEVRAAIDRHLTDRRPQYLSDVVANRLEDSLSPGLIVRDSSMPNATHLRLAALAGNGRLRAIVTTTFDHAFEAAFAELSIPLKVCDTRKDFVALAECLPDVLRRPGPCTLLKLNGSADSPYGVMSAKDWLDNNAPPEVRGVLQRLLKKCFWLCVGDDGRHLDKDGTFLGLRAASGHARGLAWLLPPGSEASTGLKELVRRFDGRATIVVGRLPEWIDSFTEPENSLSQNVGEPQQACGPSQNASTVTSLTGQDWRERCYLVVADLLLAAEELELALKQASALSAEAIFRRPNG
jgi:hypothetical protein